MTNTRKTQSPRKFDADLSSTVVELLTPDFSYMRKTTARAARAQIQNFLIDNQELTRFERHILRIELRCLADVVN